MKITIVGAGKVGTTITAQLSKEGHDITLIDTKSDVLENAQGLYDIISVAGNGASMATLQEAGIQNNDLLIAVTSRDEVNMLACITAKNINSKINCIARIRNPEYVAQAYKMSEVFGLSLVINPEKQAAVEISQLLKLPGTLSREFFAKARMEMIEIKIEEYSKLVGVKLQDLQKIVHTKVLVCAVERDGKAIMPDGSFVLRVNDKISVAAQSESLHSLLYSVGIIKKPIKHVLLAGGSKLAYYLAQELLKSHMTVNIIEIDENACNELAELLPEATIVKGDASSQAVLDAEDLSDYDAVVSCTGIDELNVIISMYATLCKVPLTITKLGRGGNTRMLDALPMGPIVCPKNLCTSHIVRYVRAMMQSSGSAALSVHQIANGNAEVLEFMVDENTKHIGESLKDISIKKNILIASITSKGVSSVADGQQKFHVGDTVVVVVARENPILNLNDIFEG